MDNCHFLEILKDSFIRYLETGPRSHEKLKILHGAISNDLEQRLFKMNDGGGEYSIHSLGYGDSKEIKIHGRYYEKTVDITVRKDERVVAGIAVKYVMSNYFQNSNNYFESMLGETANVRSNGIPYFQIFAIPDEIPYYERDGNISKFESINATHLAKYMQLSKDDPSSYWHTPDKVLIYIVKRTKSPQESYCRDSWKKYYLNIEDEFTMIDLPHDYSFSSGVIFNDYETFIKKVAHAILST